MRNSPIKPFLPSCAVSALLALTALSGCMEYYSHKIAWERVKALYPKPIPTTPFKVLISRAFWADYDARDFDPPIFYPRATLKIDLAAIRREIYIQRYIDRRGSYKQDHNHGHDHDNDNRNH